MSHPYDHARSTVRKFGGVTDDYQPIHDWFDASKEHYCNWRHRALRHHAEGIFMAERIFGVTISNSDGKKVPVRIIGEQHVKEDLGWVPTMQDWFQNIQHQTWMSRGVAKIDLEGEAHFKGTLNLVEK